MTTGGREGKWDGWSSGKHREEEVLILGMHTLYKQLHATHNWTQRLSDYG